MRILEILGSVDPQHRGVGGGSAGSDQRREDHLP